MSKLKLQMQVTIDGFDPSGANADVSMEDVRVYSSDLLDTADTIVIGRKMAEPGFISYWDKKAGITDDLWQGVAQRIASAQKVIFSKTLKTCDWRNTKVENGDLVTAVERLKKTGKKDIIVYGGVSFVASLVKEHLIDEFHLFVNPVIRGMGASIFSGLEQPQNLKLVKSLAYNNSGLVLLHYELRQ